MFLVWFNAETILLSLWQEPEVAHLASIYLRWVSLGLPGMYVLLPFCVILLKFALCFDSLCV